MNFKTKISLAAYDDDVMPRIRPDIGLCLMSAGDVCHDSRL